MLSKLKLEWMIPAEVRNLQAELQRENFLPRWELKKAFHTLCFDFRIIAF